MTKRLRSPSEIPEPTFCAYPWYRKDHEPGMGNDPDEAYRRNIMMRRGRGSEVSYIKAGEALCIKLSMYDWLLIIEINGSDRMADRYAESKEAGQLRIDRQLKKLGIRMLSDKVLPIL